MGASEGPDVKRRGRTCWSPQMSGELMTGLSLVVVVLHLSQLGSAQLIPVPGSNGSAIYKNALYRTSDLEALQALWGAWNTSTPNISTNLPGWNSIQPFPCTWSLKFDSNLSWEGVSCLRRDYNSTHYQESVYEIFITNASIVGTLPPDIGNFTDLRILQLTGNPNLTGPLPFFGYLSNLHILDLHDNGFSGFLPTDGLDFFSNLTQLDLSGNQLTGRYSFGISAFIALNVLSIGRNNLEGNISPNSFQMMTDLQTLDLSHNKFNGSLPDMTANENLKSLDVSENQFDGPLPDLTQNPRLTTANLGGNKLTLPTNATSLLDVLCNMNATNSQTTLNLSHNRLIGPLSHWNSSTSCLGSLQALYLDGNALSGTLNISKMRAWGLLQERFIDIGAGSAQNVTGGSLSVMSLRSNNISQVISDADTIANTTTSFILQGNAYCDKYDPTNDARRCYCTQICYITPASLQSDRRKITIIASVCSTGAVVLILVVVVAAYLYKTKRYKQYLQVQFEKRFEEFDVKPTIFGYNELRAATRDFHEDMKLGQGGYGAVYKGVLANGNVVAVKQLFTKSVQSIGMDEFLNEVVLITGMKHRNLVNLKGCCVRDSQRLLVYEYVDNSDVDRVLLGPKRVEAALIGWAARRRMCEGVARGLHYLHALAQPRVIHRDIKAGNVLLDSQLQPKIADFGLALLFPDDATHVHTVHVAGTKGYLAPEYASWGQLSDKVDVYSFGVLCLEIISGRRNIDTTLPPDRMYLSRWAWQLHEEGRLVELADPGLGQLSEAEAGEVERVLRVCLLCLQSAAERRPSMATVLHLLESHNQPDVQAALQNIVGKDEGPSLELTMLSELSVIEGSSAGGELSIMKGGSMPSDDGCGGSRSLLAEDSLSSLACMWTSEGGSSNTLG